jgi:hypothetical protein
MDMAGTTYKLSGLTKLDKLEYEGTDGITFSEDPLPGDKLGEPVTLSVVVTVAALTTLASILAGKYHRKTFKETVEVHYPDGRIEHRVVEWSDTLKEPPDADLLRQIRGEIQIDT